VGVFFDKDIYCEMKELIRHILREHVGEIKEVRKPKYSNYDTNDDSFANVFYLMITELKNNEGFSLSRMKKAFQYAIREWTKKSHKIISKKVAEHFIKNFPDVNPFSIVWGQRKKYGMVGGKSFLLFEHTTPVSVFLTSLSKVKTLEDVKNSMKEYSGICVITRDEDDCLNRSGFTSKRPDGWIQSYSTCGIEVMNESEYNLYKEKILNSREDETTD
jgi:hypothetical protein